MSTAQLAKHSRQLLGHRPDDVRNELPASIQTAQAHSRSWLTYWRKNPINYSCKRDKNSSQAWFIEQDDTLALNFSVKPQLQNIFANYLQELIDLRLAQYFARKNRSYPVEKTEVLRVAEEKTKE